MRVTAYVPLAQQDVGPRSRSMIIEAEAILLYELRPASSGGPMLRAVMFDFDLTLADSTAGAIDCINHALQCLGLPNAPDRRILESIGLSLPDTFAYITGKTDTRWWRRSPTTSLREPM